MFIKILRSLSLPVAYKNEWIVSTWGPDHKHLTLVIKVIESYFYPANSRKWIKTRNFLVPIPDKFIRRLSDFFLSADLYDIIGRLRCVNHVEIRRQPQSVYNLSSSDSYLMPQVLRQLVKEEAIASEPWPEDSLLYQPFDVEQILLAEQASCLAVKAYLKMCKLPFTVRTSANAEFMSPGGRMTKLPFIKVGTFVIAEFEPVVNFIETKGIKLTNHLDEDEKIDLRAHLSLVENVFTNAELYLTFMDDENYHQVTSARYGSVYPWPLKAYQNGIKRRTVIKQLNVYQWKNMTLKEVVTNVEKCCEALSFRLGDQKYFYGDSPTELDAITFGHIYAILTTKLPNNVLAETVNKFDKLVNFCNNIDKEFFRITS